MSLSTRKILLIVIDSLRLDAIAQMPNLLATTRQNGVIFTNAIASGIPTPYAVPSILSGRYPFSITVNNPPKVPTIFHTKLGNFENLFLSGQYFATWQVSELRNVLKIVDTPRPHSRPFPKERSIHSQTSTAAKIRKYLRRRLTENSKTYGAITVYQLFLALLHQNTLGIERTAHKEHLLFSNLLKWIDYPPDNTLTYLHTNLLHYPYIASGIHTRSAFESLLRSTLSAYGIRAERDILKHILQTGNKAITNAVHQTIINILKKFYLKAARNIDHLITPLVNKALSHGFFVIITSDHGEVLGEHGTHLFSHKTYYHLPSIFRIPLLVLVPQTHHQSILQQIAKNRTKPVGHIDIIPTIFDIIDVNPSFRTDGQSLLQPIEEGRIRETWSIEDGFRLIDRYGLGSIPQEMEPILTVIQNKHRITLRNTECFPLGIGCSEELKDYALKKVRFFHMRKNIALKGGNRNVRGVFERRNFRNREKTG